MSPEPKPEREKTVAERLEELRALVGAVSAPPAERPDYPISGEFRRRVRAIDPVLEDVAGKTIYTMGHQAHPWSRFLPALQHRQITHVVDVRQTPYSRVRTHFSRDWLRDGLLQEGIGYTWMQPLSGRTVRLPGYEEALVGLLLIVHRERRVCLLCVEENPKVCHRWTIIGRDLTDLGLRVINLRSRWAY